MHTLYKTALTLHQGGYLLLENCDKKGKAGSDFMREIILLSGSFAEIQFTAAHSPPQMAEEAWHTSCAWIGFDT